MINKDKKEVLLGMCPICRKKLKKDKSSIIKKNDVTTLYCVECSGCLSSVMIAVFSSNDDVVTTVGILSDLKRKDIDLLKESDSPITVDDVLSICKYIKKYETTSKK